MNPLAWLNPGRWMLYLAFAAALVAGYLAWEQHQRAIGHEAGRAEVQAQWDKEKIARQAAAVAEAQANAKETQRRIERQKDAQDAQQVEIAQARADRDRAAAAAGRLSGQLAAFTAAARGAAGHSAAACDSASAGEAICVLADLFRRADDRAGILAAAFDASYPAGAQCVRSYEALTPPH